MNFFIRLFHVPKRCRTPAPFFFSTLSTVSVFMRGSFLASASSSMFSPNTHIIAKPSIPASITTPSSFPICFIGTLPINIIRMTTSPSSAAVEKFSRKISRINGTDTHRMYLNARLSTVSPSCRALSIITSASTTAPLASSEGWNCSPPMSNHREAPFISPPVRVVINSRIIENISAKGVIILKYRQSMFMVMTRNTTPTPSNMACLSTGPR